MKKFGMGLSHMMPPRLDDKLFTKEVMMTADYTPPPSPYPGRRAPLPAKIEQDLRIACVAVLTNQRPSHIPDLHEDSARASVKAQLDYAAIKKTIDVRPVDGANGVPQPGKRRPTLTADDAPDSTKFAYRPDLPIAALFPSAFAPTGTTHTAVVPSAFPVRSSSLRRADHLLGAESAHRRTKSGPQAEAIKAPTTFATRDDRAKLVNRSGSHETCGSTPQTDSTDYPWNTSTAPTSAGVTPARASSKRTSTYVPTEHEDPHQPKTEMNPMDWIRSELQKHQIKRSRRPSEAEGSDLRSHTRAPSRSRSIRSVRSVKSLASSVRDGIVEYIRPASSRGHSRAASRARDDPAHRADVDRMERGATSRPPPRRDWRNWGKSHKDVEPSSVDVSNAPSARGRSENRKPAGKPDLNRELPPLPGLSQWKEPEPAMPLSTSSMKSMQTTPPKTSTTHVKSSPVNEKDEIVAARLGSPSTQKPKLGTYMPTRSQGVSSRSQNTTSPPYRSGLACNVDADQEIQDRGLRSDLRMSNAAAAIAFSYAYPAPPVGVLKRKPVASSPGVTSNTCAPPSSQLSRTTSSTSRSTNIKKGHSHTPSDASRSSSNLGSSAASFSRHRKYESSDIPPALTTNVTNQGRKVATKIQPVTEESKYRRAGEICHPSASQPPSKDDKKGWWHLKANSKKQPMTWMEKLEKLGVKDGVLVNDDHVGSPVVRY